MQRNAGDRMQRRALLAGGFAAALIGAPRVARAREEFAQAFSHPRIIVDPAAIFRTTVCLRPFRAEGPRIEAERFGRKIVVHNYGHGCALVSDQRGTAFAFDGY